MYPLEALGSRNNSVVRPDSATTFVECIAQLFLQFNLADLAVEEAFDQQLQAIEHLKAVQILISRLPELPINWRAILQRLINGHEVHITTVKGFRFTWLTQFAKARQIKEMAEEYGYIVSDSEHTRQLADKPIKKKQPADESSRTTTTSTAKVLCSGCGHVPIQIDRVFQLLSLCVQGIESTQAASRQVP
jgi:hypothetical protein